MMAGRITLILDRWVGYVLLLGISIAVMILALLLATVALDGWRRLSWSFLANPPSANPEKAGIAPALWGSVWVVGLATLIALPLGLATAIYLTEFSRHERLNKIIYFNLTNLAGVPSVVYGLVGLSFLTYTLGLGRSVIAGAVTLAFLILPVIVVAAVESIKAVPELHKLGAYALGANKLQVVTRVVLPESLPGALTGSILAVSRALGEAAPILVISGLLFTRSMPTSIFDQFTVLPLQIFNWITRPQAEFKELSAAAIIVLLMLLLLMNTTAIILRNRLQMRVVE